MCGMRVCVIFFVFIFVIQKSEALKGSRSIDLLESFKYEEWSDDEKHCKEATISLLEGVRNNTLWASWIWDSMQNPVGALYGSRYHLGNFDQCLEAPWTQPWPTQYCLVDVKLTDQTRPYNGEIKDPYGNVEEFLGMKTKYGRQLSSYSLGVCLPAVCSPSSAAKISRHLHQLSHLPLADITVEPGNCQVKGDKPYSIGFYVFWFIILTLATIAAVVYFVEDHLTNPKLIEMASWFSPTKNFDALTKTNQDELTSLNGLRCLCAGTAVTMHYFYYVAAPSAMNPIDIGKDMESSPGKIILQLALVIDTFFVMSGLLHMKGLLTNSSNPVKMLWKRYLRLLAPFALSLLYMSTVLHHTVSGPLWPKLMKEQTETCAKNWWLGPLMINNYVRSDAICHVVTWYLSCDYQLTIFGTAIFFLCQKLSRRNAVKFFSLTFLMSMVIPGILTYLNRLPAVFLYDIEDAGDVKLNRIFLITYMKSHSRAGAYMIGLALGYIIHSYKPRDYRKSIVKMWSIIGGLLGLSILVSVMGLGGVLLSRKYNVFEATAYASLDRSIFAVGICCLVIVSEYGTFPIVGDFLTSKVFTSISRLSYNMYLFHPALLFKMFYSTRTPVSYSFFHHFLDGFGYITVAGLMSYCLWFIVEAPAVNMINSLFKNRNKRSVGVNGTKNGSIIHNGNGTQNGSTKLFENGTKNGSMIHNGNGTQNGSTKLFENGTKNGSMTHNGNGTKNGSMIHNGNGTQNGSTKHIDDIQPNGVNPKKDL